MDWGLKIIMKHIFITCLFYTVNMWAAFSQELWQQYEEHCRQPSDINEHIPTLRQLASESASAVEIGIRGIVCTWGILQVLSESKSEKPVYLGIDIASPPDNALNLVKRLAEDGNVSFMFWLADDFEIDINETDLLFIDSYHTYAHLTYELEKFSPKVRKFIAMHDTSEPWGEENEPFYGYLPPYPSHINLSKKGLWPAVEDFLARHPEWTLKQRYFNNHGFTVLERVTPLKVAAKSSCMRFSNR